MKYLLLLLSMVMLKYMFYREGLYNKNDLSASSFKPNVSNLSDKGVTSKSLLDITNKVNTNILDNQYSMININNIPLF